MARFILPTRMPLRRFTWLTSRFCKKTRDLDAMLSVCFSWPNRRRKHSSITATPAVNAGAAPEQWTIEVLLTSDAAA